MWHFLSSSIALAIIETQTSKSQYIYNNYAVILIKIIKYF